MIIIDKYLSNKAKLAYGAAAFVYQITLGQHQKWYLSEPGFAPLNIGFNFKEAKTRVVDILASRRLLATRTERAVLEGKS